jgi:GTPase SAR1 family protein
VPVKIEGKNFLFVQIPSEKAWSSSEDEFPPKTRVLAEDSVAMLYFVDLEKIGTNIESYEPFLNQFESTCKKNKFSLPIFLVMNKLDRFNQIQGKKTNSQRKDLLKAITKDFTSRAGPMEKFVFAYQMSATDPTDCEQVFEAIFTQLTAITSTKTGDSIVFKRTFKKLLFTGTSEERKI